MLVVSGIVKNNRLEYIYIIVTVKVTIKIITLRSLTFRLRTTHTYTHKSHPIKKVFNGQKKFNSWYLFDNTSINTLAHQGPGLFSWL